jgi:hypothetical protein
MKSGRYLSTKHGYQACSVDWCRKSGFAKDGQVKAPQQRHLKTPWIRVYALVFSGRVTAII